MQKFVNLAPECKQSYLCVPDMHIKQVPSTCSNSWGLDAHLTRNHRIHESYSLLLRPICVNESDKLWKTYSTLDSDYVLNFRWKALTADRLQKGSFPKQIAPINNQRVYTLISQTLSNKRK